MALIETLIDPFNGAVVNTTPWFVTQAGGATITASYTGIQCDYPASSTASTDGDLSGNFTYDLTNSYAYMSVITVPAAITNADGVFELTQIGGTGNYLRWVYEAGTIYAQYALAYAPTTLFSVAYSSTTHAYWRIREGTGAGAGGTAGTIYFDTGVDNGNGTVTWTNRATVATTTLTITALTPILGGVCYNAQTSPGAFKYNNFNIIPAVGGNKFFF